MCLAIPGRIVAISTEERNRALVDVVGVRRHVNTALLEDDTGRMGLSDAVACAVDPAIEIIRSLIQDFNEHWTEQLVQSGKVCAK